MAVLLFSILGIIYDGYFYCFHFFHIIIGNDILLRATRVCGHVVEVLFQFCHSL